MKKKLQILMVMLFCMTGLSINLMAQYKKDVFEYSSSTAGTQNLFIKSTTTYANRYYYVAGATFNGLDYDIFVVCYDSNMDEQWEEQWDSGNGDDVASAIFVDNAGRVVVTGVAKDAWGTWTDVVVIKLANDGTELFVSTWDDPDNWIDAGTDIKMDAAKNIYCTGMALNSNGDSDVLLIKYDSTGTELWSDMHDVAGFNDAGYKLRLAGTSAAYITAGVETAAGVYRCSEIHYSSAGSYVGISTSSSSSSSNIDIVNDVAKDTSGNIFIVGSINTLSNGYDMSIMVLDSNLTVNWQATLNDSSNSDDEINSVVVDSVGNVYACGYVTSNTQGKNWAVVKYNSSGTLQWIKKFSSSGNGADVANAIKIDKQGNLVVTGYMATEINGSDFCTKKLDNSGNELWSILGDGNFHGMDKALNLAIADDGTIYITGESQQDATKMEYRTVRYIENNIIPKPKEANADTAMARFEYYENKGQIMKVNGSGVVSTISSKELRYYTNNTNPKFYIKDSCFSFVYAHVDTSATTPDTLERINVTFKSVGVKAKVYPLEEKEDYLSYFLSHIPDGATEIHGNQRLITVGLYSKIDLMYCSNQKGFKYYFIVNPGGNPANIKMHISGANSVVLDTVASILRINGLLGKMVWDKPLVYQLSSTNTVDTILTGAKWKAVTGDYGFYVPTYDTHKPLIIEVDRGNGASSMNATYQNIIWSTYMGDVSDDEFDKVVTKQNGVYVAGRSMSPHFPTVIGDYTTSNLAGAKMAIAVKFNKAGFRQHATYYGNGNGNVDIWNVKGAVDSKKCFYLTGDVGSLSGNKIPFPSSQPPAAYADTSYIAGHTAVFVAKFDSTFTHLNWVTYYAGPHGLSWYGYPDLNIDPVDNIYLTYTGDTTSPLLHEPGAYFDSLTGGSTIVKFDSTMHRKWATRFGALYTYVECGAFDPAGNFYISGEVTVPFYSPFPFKTPGFPAYEDTTINNGDIFIAKFDKNTDSLKWATAYGGNGGDDGWDMAFDDGGSFYITGNTFSTNFPCHYAGSGSYIDSTFSTGASAMDAYMIKFGPSLDLKWATLFGSGDEEKGYGVACDPITRDVFFTGYTKSSNDTMWGGASYYSQSYGGNYDAYILAFTNTLVPMWSTYLGYSANEMGYSVATNTHNQLFMVGYTDSHQYSHFLNVNPGNNAWFVDTLTGGLDAHITSFIIDTANHTGIMENHILYNDGLTIYPNPTSGNFNYVLKTDDKNIQLKVYNILGELVHLDKLSSGTGMYKGVIDLTDYQNGIYFVIAEVGNKLITHKIMKQ